MHSPPCAAVPGELSQDTAPDFRYIAHAGVLDPQSSHLEGQHEHLHGRVLVVGRRARGQLDHRDAE